MKIKITNNLLFKEIKNNVKNNNIFLILLRVLLKKIIVFLKKVKENKKELAA